MVEGIGTLTDHLAQQLGSRVLTGHRVTHISYGDEGVTVETSGGVVRAARAVVTVAPPMLASVQFEPPLPEAHSRFVQNTHMGTVYKVIAVYDTPFWRARRKHAEFILLDEPGGCRLRQHAAGRPGTSHHFGRRP